MACAGGAPEGIRPNDCRLPELQHRLLPITPELKFVILYVSLFQSYKFNLGVPIKNYIGKILQSFDL
jgi:hypothetical protein